MTKNQLLTENDIKTLVDLVKAFGFLKVKKIDYKGIIFIEFIEDDKIKK